MRLAMGDGFAPAAQRDARPSDARRVASKLRLLLGAFGVGVLVTAASAAIVGDLAAGMTDHATPPDVVASRPAGPSAAEIGAQLREALLREADQPVKANWSPMLRYLADLHARSILPARAHLPYPYQTMGPGYQDGTVFGHIDLTHERLDTVRALPQHVRNQIYNELAGQQPDGLIPGIVLFKPGDIASWKTFKGFPPIWVIAVDAYVEETGDTPVLRKCRDALIRQIGWFERQRAVAGGGFFYIDQREGTWESGIDEGVRYDERLTTPAAAVDASAHVFMLYEHAANWSRALGQPAREWEQKARALQDFIRRELWDPQTGFFYDAWTVREPARRRLAFEGMWPVVVGAATAEQARRVIDEHLLNPREFFTPHPIATVARSDAKFELRMWRGPAWNSMTYWAARGCARYGRGDAAHRILEAALDGTATQFERTGTIWEFHHPERGDEESLRRKPTRNLPCRDYVGHNPLFAMADLWRRTMPAPAPLGRVDHPRRGVEEPVFADAGGGGDAALGGCDESTATPGPHEAVAVATSRRRRAPDPARKRKSAPRKKGAAPQPAPAGRPEITWSLMHPVKPDPAYMKDVIAAAAAYQVDSFEICGDVHCNGNLDGAIRFRDYPTVADTIDARKVEENIRVLREIVALAHASGRPVYYWHREVMVPRAVVEKLPGLLDENGEFNLLGEAYHALVRSKIREFFDHVPDLDGLVLTLTESDYSVIHNSDPERYPPAQVVQRILETFAAELHVRGKRLVLRSFGSIAQDYEDILAGAAAARTTVPFEIETKITPYDFSPFLPTNPYLRRTEQCTLGAEYDSIGEFLGAGYLPAPDPARVLQTVAYARQQGVNRHVIRVDRIGHAAFRSTQAINLFAFERAIRDPAATADDVWRDWAWTHWAGCPDEMIAVMKRGIEMVKRTHFIDGNVIFHAFPIPPDWKWIKAGGILSTFSPARSLAVHPNMWGILPDRTTPSRAALLREKDEAVELAAAGLQAVDALRDRLSPEEYQTAHAAWQRAVVVTRTIRAWCRCIAAYFDDLEQGGRGQPSLGAALAAANAELAPFLPASGATIAPDLAGAHEYGQEGPAEDSIEAAYLSPIGALLRQLSSEYEAEQAERAAWQGRPGLVDFVVAGGFLDDIRVDRPMHASHAHLLAGRPVRVVGNRVFPNGAIEVRLRAPAHRPARLIITGNPAAAGQFKLTVQGVTQTAVFPAAGEYGWDLPATPSDAGAALSVPEGRNEATREIVVRIQKSGLEYPALHGIGIVAC
ncbi:trehalase family glycosidase [Opitutus sp. ER46]|uniref:amylo-alpha-1,6-glucosidase n=1 Tax=Opitutus sp. ER46 TaxID=2161864 RepID=UPI001304BF42|nr:trehalase family glycosidase [Opitutus sp. ER46]